MIGVVIANYAVRFLLVQDGGKHDVGLFGVALRLASGIALVTGAFSMAWGPFGLALPDSEQTARLFGRVIRAVPLMAVLLSVALGAAAPELITLVSGGAYRGAATMLPGLLIAAAMTGGFYVLLVAAGVSRRGHAVAYAAVAGAALQVALTAVLLPSTGLQAVGVGAVAGQALALVLLGLAVGRSVVRGTEAVVVMCAGGAACNCHPRTQCNPRRDISKASDCGRFARSWPGCWASGSSGDGLPANSADGDTMRVLIADNQYAWHPGFGEAVRRGHDATVIAALNNGLSALGAQQPQVTSGQANEKRRLEVGNRPSDGL